MITQAHSMDRIYRHQRYIYDATRKYFLFGRDTLLRRLPVRAADTVMEIGCGTARNLVVLHRLQPEARLFGLDASSQMLLTAHAKLAAHGLAQSVHLTCALAHELDYRACGLEQAFDVIFFSYALSMIRPWQPALEAALCNLKPGGWLGIVDFSAQSRLPRWCHTLLWDWLERFEVYHDPALPEYLRQLHADGRGHLQFATLTGDYAYLALLRKD